MISLVKWLPNLSVPLRADQSQNKGNQMPVIYHMAVKTARMTATRDSVANGSLEMLSAANTVLAIFGLAPAAGTVSNDIWTLELDDPDVNGEVAAGAGTNATKARIKDSGGTVRVSGLTVGLPGSGADFIMVNTSITSGQEVGPTSGSIQHAPDPT